MDDFWNNNPEKAMDLIRILFEIYQESKFNLENF